MQPHWDLFCRVIDNYGDIGVCWRLARQLAAEHGLAVRLWVDAPATLAPLCPEIDPRLPAQTVAGVDIRRWGEPFPSVEASEVVIEAFACDLPAAYLRAMASRTPAPRWINLEYLSAEAWVEGCHRLASPHPTLPLAKHFFFPGFTPKTGGLLREGGLFAERERFQRPASDALQVGLFCYDTAPVGDLLAAWAAGPQPVHCRVPPGKPLDAVRRHLGGDGPWRRGNLLVEPIAFVPQPEYDRLLWQCDVNFVRGEDSFVRAQWAARPFVWQIYPQDEEAHLDKLEAFLDLYLAGLPPPAASAVRRMFLAWNGKGEIAPAWSDYLARRPQLEEYGRRWTDSLAQQGDLAANLVRFCDSTL